MNEIQKKCLLMALQALPDVPATDRTDANLEIMNIVESFLTQKKKTKTKSKKRARKKKK